MKKLIRFFQWLNLPLGWKLLAGFASTNLVLLIALGLGVVALFASGNELKTLKTSNERLQQVNQIHTAQNRLVRSTLDYQWSGNLSRLNDFDLAKTDLARLLKSFEAGPNQNETLLQLQKQSENLQQLLGKISTLDNNDAQEEQAKALWRDQGSKLAEQVRGLVDQLEIQELHNSEVGYEQISGQVIQAIWLVCGLSLAALGLALGLALLLTVAFTNPVRILRNCLAGLSKGDLTQSIEIVNRDELGELGHTYNTTMAALRQLVAQLWEQSQVVAETTGELTSQASVQVTGSSQQSVAVAEATQALEELNLSADQIAQQAEKTSQAVSHSLELSQQVDQLAETMMQAQTDGRATLAEAITALKELQTEVQTTSSEQALLSEKSQSIASAIELINGIAQETHLLALNAAIEASGAGAYGDRFAVIAAEIKQLARRSLNATEIIRAELGGVRSSVEDTGRRSEVSLSKVWRTVAAADQADKAMLRIIGLSQQVKEAVVGIVAETKSTAEQATSIGIATRQQQVSSRQMVERMLEIEAVTSQTLSTVRQGEQATHNLNLSARALKQSAGSFKLKTV